MKPMWVIQQNLNYDDMELLPVLDAAGIKYHLIKIIPFFDSIPDVDYDGPLIARGSTTTLKGVEKKSWRPGVWHNENFKPSAYRDHYGELFINGDGEVHLLKDAPYLENWKARSLKFVRPNSDYKDLTGRIMNKRDLRKLERGVALGQYPFDTSLELFLASPKTVESEARFTVINGQVVSGYFYRVDRRLRRTPASKEFRDVAEKAAAMWGPDEVYMLDIGITKLGKVGVIECNCFNASGIYGDAATIFQEVTKFVESKYS